MKSKRALRGIFAFLLVVGTSQGVVMAEQSVSAESLYEAARQRESAVGRVDDETLKLFEASCKLGHAKACVALGYNILEFQENKEKGIHLLNPLALKGDGTACYWLAQHYLKGSRLVPERKKRAHYYFELGARHGDTACSVNLQVLIYFGYLDGDKKAALEKLRIIAGIKLEARALYVDSLNIDFALGIVNNDKEIVNGFKDEHNFIVREYYNKKNPGYVIPLEEIDLHK